MGTLTLVYATIYGTGITVIAINGLHAFSGIGSIGAVIGTAGAKGQKR
jgi:hypothetical protein